MSISLTPLGGTAVALPPDLLWVNEFGWSALAQSKERGITGALIVDVAPRVAGRSVILQGGVNSGWLTRSCLKQLQILASQPAAQFDLSWNGEVLRVAFDHGSEESSPPVFASPVVEYSDPLDGDLYHSLQLRFMTI